MSASEWIEWPGGKCPVPTGTHIAYRMRGAPGDRYTRYPAHLPWIHYGGRFDIIAYRVVEQAA